jgi:hypothetical protein
MSPHRSTDVLLKEKSLNWAARHVLRDGDTDLFPRPFEFSVIKQNWKEIRAELATIKLNNHTWSGTRRLIVPKSDFAFRAVTQLDPLDAILFAALIKEIGQKIEARRLRPSDSTVFSYRFDPSSDGRLYSPVSGWEAFWATTSRHCQNFSTVLVTDISDWYNQIYHHTLENQLLQCGLHSGYWHSIKNLVANSTEGVSRGLPIGPHPAHLLAELAMVPTDEFLTSENVTFCRYVDDIHIFCDNEAEAQKRLFKLVDFLDRTQKIQLNRGKTRIISATAYRAEADKNVVDQPISKLERDMLAAVRTYTTSPYERIPIKNVASVDLATLSRGNIERVLNEYLSAGDVDYIRLRWFIRRLSQLGVAGGIEFMVRRFTDLLPALSEVAQYFEAANGAYEGSWKDIGHDLLSLYNSDVVQASEYLRVVILILFFII